MTNNCTCHWQTFVSSSRQHIPQNAHSVQRHIILVRHGQCNLNDPNQILTKLGRHQAKLTGKRLQELKWPIGEMITSKLSRAQETGQIISTFLSPTIIKSEDEALNEGNPIKPVPTEYWTIDSDVSVFVKFILHRNESVFVSHSDRCCRCGKNRSGIWKVFSSSRCGTRDRFLHNDR